MLNRVQNSLTSSVYGPGGPPYDQNGEDENYQQVPVNQLKQVFSQQPDYAQQHDEEPEPYKSVKDLKSMYNQKTKSTAANRPSRSRPRPASHSPGRPTWTKPTDGDSGLPEPGWSPVKAPSSAPHFPNANRYAPPNRPAPVNRPQPAPAYQPQHVPVNRPQPVPVNRPPPQLQQDDFKPAWAGSLKSSGGPKQWEVREQSAIAQGGPAPPHMQEHSAPAPHQPRVQNVHYGPGGASPQYQQQADGGASDNARVAHLQYNTPIGLYSKQNVEEVLTGQTAGRPGEGTIQVTGGGPPGQKAWDPNRSEVLRLLQEEERPAHPRGYGLRPTAAPQQQQQAPPRGQQEEQHYAGYVDPNKQSPMMHALENQMENVQVGDGTSDF